VAGVLAWSFWSRLQAPVPSVERSEVAPFVRVTVPGQGSADQILQERASLYDPTPLFFPTEWNYGQRPLPDALRRQPGQVFGSFEPRLTFDGAAMRVFGHETVPVPEKLSDVLMQGNEAPFAGFGRVDISRAALAERVAAVGVTRLADGKTVIEEELKDLQVPRPDFGPMEFLVLVGKEGMIMDPVLLVSSGREDIDVFFRAYLVKNSRLGYRLTAGQYRVWLGP
jgi:hypothetical protein